MIDYWSGRGAAKREQRLRAAVRAYNRAITMKAREMFASGQEEFVPLLPPKVTVDGVKARIHNSNEFRRIVGYQGDLAHGRSSELTRVLKAYDPHALDIVKGSTPSTFTTKFGKKEARYHKAKVTRNSNQLKKLIDISDSMSAPEYATAIDNTQMIPDEGEYDDTYEDLSPQTYENWRNEDAKAKSDAIGVPSMYGLYMQFWNDPSNRHQDLEGFAAVNDAMDWLAEHRPDVLNKMFNSGRDEMDPPWLLESDTTPYSSIPHETRHARAVSYILKEASAAGYQQNIVVNKGDDTYIVDINTGEIIESGKIKTVPVNGKSKRVNMVTGEILESNVKTMTANGKTVKVDMSTGEIVG